MTEAEIWTYGYRLGEFAVQGRKCLRGFEIKLAVAGADDADTLKELEEHGVWFSPMFSLNLVMVRESGKLEHPWIDYAEADPAGYIKLYRMALSLLGLETHPYYNSDLHKDTWVEIPECIGEVIRKLRHRKATTDIHPAIEKKIKNIIDCKFRHRHIRDVRHNLSKRKP